LHVCSREYARAPDNYLRLTSALLELPETIFVTLNYDTLLDSRLALHSPLDELPDYIGPRNPQWSLVKLHGSVNWGRAIRGPAEFSFTHPTPELHVDDEILVTGAPSARLETLRGREGDGESFYPALSVPVGEDDEIVCPPAHVEHLRERLGTADAIHLLIIGYSANDREVLNLLKESGSEIGSLLIVNRSEEACGYVERRLAEHLGVRFGFNRPYFSTGFGAFTTEAQGLPQYVRFIRDALGA
jgi:hypothetical protein